MVKKRKGLPILNIKDLTTKRVSMEVVPRKGNNEYAAEVFTGFIKGAAYTNLNITSDQEPAIGSLVDMVKVQSHANINTEKSPVGESSSNGEIESQIRRNTALVRLTKLFLDSHIKERIEADWAMVPWIIRHAGCIIDYFRKDGSGITPWQHKKARPSTKKLAIVGESVWYLMPSSLGSDKLDER